MNSTHFWLLAFPRWEKPDIQRDNNETRGGIHDACWTIAYNASQNDSKKRWNRWASKVPLRSQCCHCFWLIHILKRREGRRGGKWRRISEITKFCCMYVEAQAQEWGKKTELYCIVSGSDRWKAKCQMGGCGRFGCSKRSSEGGCHLTITISSAFHWQTKTMARDFALRCMWPHLIKNDWKSQLMFM